MSDTNAYWNYLRNSDWMMRMIYGDEKFRQFYVEQFVNMAKNEMVQASSSPNRINILAADISAAVFEKFSLNVNENHVASMIDGIMRERGIEISADENNRLNMSTLVQCCMDLISRDIAKRNLSRDGSLVNSIVTGYASSEHSSMKGLGRMQIPVHEIFEVIVDGSGETLRQLCLQSMGEPSKFGNKRPTLSADQIEEESRKKILEYVMRSKSVLQTSVDYERKAESSEDQDQYVRARLSNDDIDDIVSNMSAVEITARYALKYYSTGTNERLGLMTRRIIFLILLNVYARTKGMITNSESGASCNYVHLLKDVRDAFIFACPVLWPDIMKWLRNPNVHNPAHFMLPNSRRCLCRFLEDTVNIQLQKILSIKVTADDYSQSWSTGRPIDDMIRFLRFQYLSWVHTQHLDVRISQDRVNSSSMMVRNNC